MNFVLISCSNAELLQNDISAIFIRGRSKLVRQLSQRKTITIPAEVLERTGSKPGDFFEITEDGYRIILVPKVIEDKFTEEEWEKINLLAREKGEAYDKAVDAKQHLKDL
jgi:bifunctional DNA-binding transcriptional regulator/antitoxin component of YhaV-PrlF toxin-antitoxin module